MVLIYTNSVYHMLQVQLLLFLFPNFTLWVCFYENDIRYTVKIVNLDHVYLDIQYTDKNLGKKASFRIPQKKNYYLNRTLHSGSREEKWRKSGLTKH